MTRLIDPVGEFEQKWPSKGDAEDGLISISISRPAKVASANWSTHTVPLSPVGWSPQVYDSARGGPTGGGAESRAAGYLLVAFFRVRRVCD